MQVDRIASVESVSSPTGRFQPHTPRPIPKNDLRPTGSRTELPRTRGWKGKIYFLPEDASARSPLRSLSPRAAISVHSTLDRQAVEWKHSSTDSYPFREVVRLGTDRQSIRGSNRREEIIGSAVFHRTRSIDLEPTGSRYETSSTSLPRLIQPRQAEGGRGKTVGQEPYCI